MKFKCFKLRGFILAVLLSLGALGSSAQGTINTMFYNVLNFPNPVPAGRWDTLQNILEYHPVDLLMICELKSEAGADSILTRALNINGETAYKRANFVLQTSNPTSGYKLMQMVLYNSDKMELVNEDLILTPVRDINEYIFYLKDPDLATTQDTTYLDVYVTHLKSSQGSTNENLRKSMVDSLVKHLDARPSNRNVLFSGDFNVYSSSEPAYQEIISTQNNIVLKDPINTPGNWNNNGSYSNVHTQSTRSSSIFSDGAGGGLDDRFDFIMFSENIMNGTDGISYQNGSYQALGNNGTCFNQSITSCSPNTVPDHVISSLYYMSDHLPVVATLTTSFPLGIAAQESNGFNLFFTNGNVVQNQLQITIESDQSITGELIIIDALGREHSRKSIRHGSGTSNFQLNTQALNSGIYFLRYSATSKVLRFVKQ
jgi:hypothetical protein